MVCNACEETSSFSVEGCPLEHGCLAPGRVGGAWGAELVFLERLVGTGASLGASPPSVSSALQKEETHQ